MISNLIFLKLGGSFITDKSSPHTVHRELISRLGQEIHLAIKQDPSIRLVLGHGSGSFGHIPAKKYGTRKGVSTSEGWHGFWEVWKEAHALNQIVLEELTKIDLKVLTFPPSAMVSTLDHKVQNWNVYSIRTAIEKEYLPLVYGDVVFDALLGGTILSTEELFSFLSCELKPSRIILVGKEKGIFADFPKTKELIHFINHINITNIQSSVFEASVVDVTGGMRSKLNLMWNLCESDPKLIIDFLSPDEETPLHKIILGAQTGTRMQY